MNCNPDPNFRMVRTLAHQGAGGVVRSMHSRCDACLAYWETDTSGKIVKLSRPVSIEICPDCHKPFGDNLPQEKYLCKNPGHVASSLLKAEP